MFTTGTFLFSKEYFVITHEYYNGLSLAVMCILATKYIGPPLAKILDKEVDEYEKGLNDVKAWNIETMKQGVVNEKWAQYCSEGQLVLAAAKLENVNLQVEGEFRRRQMEVYNQVKNRLDYHMKVRMQSFIST